jgi:hypothetical protein
MANYLFVKDVSTAAPNAFTTTKSDKRKSVITQWTTLTDKFAHTSARPPSKVYVEALLSRIGILERQLQYLQPGQHARQDTQRSKPTPLVSFDDTSRPRMILTGTQVGTMRTQAEATDAMSPLDDERDLIQHKYTATLTSPRTAISATLALQVISIYYAGRSMSPRRKPRRQMISSCMNKRSPLGFLSTRRIICLIFYERGRTPGSI